MFHVNTGLYVIRGGPNLGVLAHGYKYYLAAWVFCGKLLAVPEAQCGTCCLYLCVCVCVLCTQQLVCVLTCSSDKCTQSLACARTFSSNEIQNDKLTSTKSASDMPSGHGLRRTSFDAVRPLDELASDRIGNLSILMQALMKSWTCSQLISPSAAMARGTVWHRNCMD
jgi:hypothetical protein